MTTAKTRKPSTKVGFSININFNLRSKIPADKLTSIHCIIRYNKQKILIPNIAKVEPKNWDDEIQRSRNAKYLNSEGRKLNDTLEGEERKIIGVFEEYTSKYGKYPSADQFKKLCVEKLDKEAPSPKEGSINDLLSFTELFIKESESGFRLSDKGTPITSNTIKIYRTFKHNLIDFKDKTRYNTEFNNIGLEFFEDFKEYMITEKLYSTNTVAKHIRTIKTIINEAKDRGLTSTDFTGKRYKAKTETTETIYLNESELETLFNLDLTNNPRLDKVRDLFIVGCWTGLRFSDFSNITNKNIKGDYIEIKTQKTRKKVVIPIHPYVRAIMEKYEDKTENSLPPTISNQKMNEYLKEIGEKAGFNESIHIEYTKGGKKVIENPPKYTLISTHTARRSFATNMFKMGVPSLTIMQITGHQTDSSFMKYIRVTPKEHAEKLKQLWSIPRLKIVND